MTSFAPRAAVAIEAPKLATMVARRLEDEIIRRGWPVGDVVGSEADLLELFGVSRAVLREAIRIVEHTGAARMRRGPGGGLVVSEPNRDAVVSAMGVWFAYVGVTLNELVEARRALLVPTCRLAAARIDDGRGAALRAACDEALAPARPLARRLNDAEALIAREARNPALSLLLASLADVGVRLLRSGRAVLEPALTTAEVERHVDEYRALVDAIVARDAERAGSAADALLDFVSGRVVDRAPEDRPSSTREAPRNGKLAEGLARALQDDIEESGWPVGAVLGSEAELVERYDVSRAILREAVRILEHHGAVRTKRGPRGGLIVAAPDGVALVRSARIVLEYERVAAEDLVEAREVVEAATSRLAAARRTTDDLTRLQTTLAAEARAGDAAVSFAALHDEVANTTNNRVLRVFADVVDSLVPTHLRPERQNAAALATLSAEVHRAHERIVDAIVAGDPDLAERRMLRHLRASSSVLQ